MSAQLDEAVKAVTLAIEYHAIVLHNSSATNPQGARHIHDARDRVQAALRAFADAIREDVLNTEIATWPAVTPTKVIVDHDADTIVQGCQCPSCETHWRQKAAR